MDIFSEEFNDNIDDIVSKIIDDTEKSLTSENIEERKHLNILMIDYLRRIGRTPEEDYSDVIPISFELLGDNAKISVLKDCLDNQIVIEKSSVYNSLIEGNYDEKKTEDFGRMI